MLHFDKTNPNQLNDQQMHGLRRSMERFGYLTPIIVDKDYNVADGEHRALIYKEFGLKEIPAYVIDLKDDTERRLLRQTMNKLRGQHEPQMDADEIAILYESNKINELSTLIAQQQDDILAQLEKYKPEIVTTPQTEDFDLEQAIQEAEQKPAITKLGDIWQLGQHRLLCADATDRMALEKLMDDKKVDMMFTDPPYGIAYQDIKGKHDKIKNDELNEPELRELLETAFKGCPSIGYVCCNWNSISIMKQALENIGRAVKACIVWDKERGVQNLDKYFKQHEFILYFGPFGGQKTIRGDVWRVPRRTSLNHPTEKPLELVNWAITDSTIVDDTVYDPFSGSGSTLIACEHTGRRFLGMEIEPHYCDVIIKRWEMATGQKATREGT